DRAAVLKHVPLTRLLSVLLRRSGGLVSHGARGLAGIVEPAAQHRNRNRNFNRSRKEHMKLAKKAAQIPYTFFLLNWAAVAGLYCYVRGHQDFWDLVPQSTVRTPQLRQS